MSYGNSSLSFNVEYLLSIARLPEETNVGHAIKDQRVIVYVW
jgi:hypothetical protein